MIADICRIEDEEQLRGKVSEAVAVFNDYIKTQGNESSGDQEASTDGPAPEGENEGAKA